MRLKRRNFMIGSGAALAATSMPGIASARSSGQVVVCSWGGAFAEASGEAVLRPLSEATSITIVESTGPELAQIQAMVESGTGDWAAVSLTRADHRTLVDRGIFESPDDRDVGMAALDAACPECVLFSAEHQVSILPLL
ncbi:MAG: hypothetical protein AAF637_05645 [Pseudomonadota bacterium]